MRKQMYAGLLVMILHSATLAQTAEHKPLVITGQVLDDQGGPVFGAVASANPDGGLRGKVPSASSDARGEFTIVLSRPGSYMVTASKLTDGYPSSFNPFYYPSEDPLARVIVGEDQAVPFVTVRLGPKAGKIAGRIVDVETGRPVEDAQITLCRAEAPKYCHRPSATYPGGQFSILVPPAPFTIGISASGYKNWYGAEVVDEQPIPLHVATGVTRMLSVSLEKLPAHGAVVNPSALEAPQILSPVNGAEFDHYPRTTRLEWTAVPGAASYTVELEVCQPGGADGKECQRSQLLQMRRNPPLSGIEGTSYEFLFIGAQPGRWRVWAADAKGRMGVKSVWSIFIYKR